ncbi:hypothetical protein CEXT_337831 [Caerostris extrusa]|uniref:Uncharacterized protein n=1 Tax=Caerostris extrusa TaxID=172846 RepID=A0AAV4TD29_CAEEX|nr:hypothetical protein CEXT_337831 [Caerostris extrusa]
MSHPDVLPMFKIGYESSRTVVADSADAGHMRSLRPVDSPFGLNGPARLRFVTSSSIRSECFCASLARIPDPGIQLTGGKLLPPYISELYCQKTDSNYRSADLIAILLVLSAVNYTSHLGKNKLFFGNYGCNASHQLLDYPSHWRFLGKPSGNMQTLKQLSLKNISRRVYPTSLLVNRHRRSSA